MKRTLPYVVALLAFVAAESMHVVPRAQPAAQQGPDYNLYYQIGPDSLPHDGVPKGDVRGPFVLPSQAYPGTQHTYWVYVPAQYDPAVAASLMIFQDGQAFKDLAGMVLAPNVLDNLMYRREIPVMIAIFINPGRTPEQPEPTPTDWGDRTTNRPTEYNSLDDKYARVVVDELMPVLYKEYNISKDPEQHGIGGASSGAIAAFTVAWQRPNDFHKVLSIVGSFVNLRGGDAYADIVRQSDKKPIRIFLQDGRNDNRGVGRGGTYDQGRDWFYQNVRLMQALTDKGYDVNYTWGINTHGQRMGGPILPEMMRWLWRDHPVSTDVNDAVERSFNEPKKQSAGGPPPPVQTTAADDHQRVMDLFHIAKLPPGPRSGCPETYDEATANPFPKLPDPLVMKNGKKVTSAGMWKQRRAEILEDFEREIYGRTPKVTPRVKWEVASTTEGMAGEVPTLTKQLIGHVDNSSYPAITVDIHATLTTPRNATGPVPVMMIFGGGGLGAQPAVPGTGAPGSAGARGAVPGARGPVVPVVCDNAVAKAYAAAANPPAAPPAPAGPRAGLPGAASGPGRGSGGPNQTQILLLAKGWGYATVNPGSIQADNGAGLTQGIIGLVNKGQHRKPDDWGALSAWAWGASRVLDYFETDTSVNARQVGLEGHSRYGKATIVAMALDERFAIAYVSSSGEGGAKLHRRKYGELVQNVAATNEYHWMAENHMKYADKWDSMPVDSHELVALCAPRPIFLSAGKGPETNPDGTVAMKPDGSAVSINDAWVDAKGTFLAGAGASPVYKLLGKKPMMTKEFPPIETLVDGDVAFRQHSGGHTDGPNWPVFLTWAERSIGAKASTAK